MEARKRKAELRLGDKKKSPSGKGQMEQINVRFHTASL
nr:MAG TPA: hypothetical protein [Caudoviricetes sp.]